jgi:hypothetical protein
MLPHRKIRDKRGRCSDEGSDAREWCDVSGRHAFVEKAHVAGGGVNQPQEHPDGRRLPGPVRSEKSEDLSPCYLERYAVDGV